MRPTLITLNAAAFRTPFYNSLVQDYGYRVVVLTTKQGDVANLDKKVEVIPTRKFFGFIFPSKRVEILSTDQIVGNFDLWLLPWFIATIGIGRIIFWGIGVGNGRLGNFVRKRVLKRSKGLLSYMPSGLSLTGTKQRTKNAYLINSLFIPDSEPIWEVSNHLVFLGTVDHRKRLDVLVHAIHHLKEMGEDWNVTVIGDGPALPQMKDLVQSLSLEDRITFAGRVTSDTEKKKLLSGAFLTVLPGQSGLSVLESFAYGIPVLTWKDAISGGENDNVVDGATGFLTQKLCPIQFSLTLSMLSKTPDRVKYASELCHHFYSFSASGEMMTKRFTHQVNLLADQNINKA